MLKNKVAVVTGGTRGIGKAIVDLFAKNGAKVAYTYLTSDDKARDIDRSLGGNVKGYKSNVSKFEECDNFVKSVLEGFGKIDILVNNAGITDDNLLIRMTQQQWSNVIKSNLDSIFNMTKLVVMPMLKQRKGSIINLTSIVGIKGNAGQSNYASSKAGVIGFTKSIALELGTKNIRSNCIAPGFIKTDMTDKLNKEYMENWIKTIPLKRAGLGEDVANVAMFLASDLSSYVTGEVINVSGGMLT